MVVLGVEIELHVEGYPDPLSEYYGDYPIYVAHNKGTARGRTHHRNGSLARKVTEIGEGFLKVGYDATASFGETFWEGYEISGDPGTLEENKAAWSRLYDSEVKQYLKASPDLSGLVVPEHHSCGMHVHISGLDEPTIRGIVNLINDRDHAVPLEYISGRYDSRYCKIHSYEPGHIANLFHSSDCFCKGKIDRSALNGSAWCCDNFRNLLITYQAGRTYHRGATYLIPSPNTGDMEIRMFASPDDKQMLLARLEFVHALTQFCSEGDSNLQAFCHWLESNRERRGYYRNLFRYLRLREYVRGLIPRGQIHNNVSDRPANQAIDFNG